MALFSFYMRGDLCCPNCSTDFRDNGNVLRMETNVQTLEMDVNDEGDLMDPLAEDAKLIVDVPSDSPAKIFCKNCNNDISVLFWMNEER